MNQQIIHKLGIAAAYAFLSSVALNFFGCQEKSMPAESRDFRNCCRNC